MEYKFDRERIYNVYCIIDDKLTNKSCLLAYCYCLFKINLLSFKADNVTDISYMFYCCSSLKEVNLSSFKTYNVEFIF